MCFQAGTAIDEMRTPRYFSLCTAMLALPRPSDRSLRIPAASREDTLSRNAYMALGSSVPNSHAPAGWLPVPASTSSAESLVRWLASPPGPVRCSS